MGAAIDCHALRPCDAWRGRHRSVSLVPRPSGIPQSIGATAPVRPFCRPETTAVGRCSIWMRKRKLLASVRQSTSANSRLADIRRFRRKTADPVKVHALVQFDFNVVDNCQGSRLAAKRPDRRGSARQSSQCTLRNALGPKNLATSQGLPTCWAPSIKTGLPVDCFLQAVSFAKVSRSSIERAGDGENVLWMAQNSASFHCYAHKMVQLVLASPHIGSPCRCLGSTTQPTPY